MKKKEIQKIEEYFNCYSDSPMYSYLWNNPKPCKRYSHKEQSEFHVVVFSDDNEVYQGGTEADIIGCELRTFEELVIRFESFTRDKIDNISDIGLYDEKEFNENTDENPAQ